MWHVEVFTLPHAFLREFLWDSTGKFPEIPGLLPPKMVVFECLVQSSHFPIFGMTVTGTLITGKHTSSLTAMVTESKGTCKMVNSYNFNKLPEIHWNFGKSRTWDFPDVYYLKTTNYLLWPVLLVLIVVSCGIHLLAFLFPARVSVTPTTPEGERARSQWRNACQRENRAHLILLVTRRKERGREKKCLLKGNSMLQCHSKAGSPAHTSIADSSDTTLGPDTFNINDIDRLHSRWGLV